MATQFLAVFAFIALAQLKALTYSPAGPSSATTLEDVRSSLILAAKGLHDQGQNYYLLYTIFHVVQNSMDDDDRDLMRRYVFVEGEDDQAKQLRTKRVLSQYPVSITRITDDPESQRLGNLIQKYADVAVDQQSISGQSDEGRSTPGEP